MNNKRMIKFYIYNSQGALIDQGETSVRNIGYITMPLSVNDVRIVLESADHQEKASA